MSKNADMAEIKKSYRSLARELHPDLHPGDAKAEERFKEVAAAYDFLSDPELKARFDRGEIDASGAPRAERTYYRSYAERDPAGRYSDPGEHFSEFEGMDIFADLFGGRASRSQRGGFSTGGIRGGDIQASMEVDFLGAANGTSRDVHLPDGKHLRVTIPPGTRDGQVLRLKGQGMEGLGGGPAGDLQIEIHVHPHPSFRREGNDIHSELPVTLSEALLGARVEVPTIDGRVNVTIPPASNSGTRLRLKNKGVRTSASGTERGNHYVTLKVVLPDPPDDELTQLVEQWAREHTYEVRSD